MQSFSVTSSPNQFVDMENPDRTSSGPSQDNPTTITRKMRSLQIILILFIIIVISLSAAVGVLNHRLNNVETLKIAMNSKGVTPDDIASMSAAIDSTRDAAADPCNDFYQYACGSWLRDTKIPLGSARWSRSFEVIGQQNQQLVDDIIRDDWPMLSQFYDSCNRTDTIEALGITPLKPFFNFINDTSNSIEKVAAILYNQTATQAFFRLGVVIDAKNSSRSIIEFSQGGTSIASLQKYTDDNLMGLYKTHISTMFIEAELIANDKQTTSVTDDIVTFEKGLAQISLDDPVALRDPVATYNAQTYSELKALMPDWNFDEYFSSIPALSWIPNDPEAKFTVEDVDFLVTLNKNIVAVKSDPLLLRYYLIWRLLHNYADALSSIFVDTDFNFFGASVLGQKVQPERRKKCTAQATSSLGDIVGRLFLQRAWPGKSQTVVQQLITQIRDAFDKNFHTVEWMMPDARVAAGEKLQKIKELIGGKPATWNLYDNALMRRDDYFGNLLQLRTNEVKRILTRLKQPANPYKWSMTQPTVNAYYSPVYNSINFPAGILQSPFFNEKFPMAMNFGGIGMIAAHELSHAFDDSGRQYNGDGMLTEWWDNTTSRNFEKRKDCFIEQYNQFTFNLTTASGWSEAQVSGSLTIGENIADNGGIRMAHKAYMNWLQTNQDLQLSLSPALTHEQLFFVAFAQGWCRLYRDATLRNALKHDVHAPSKARVNGPLQNYAAFSTAFNCPVGSYMNPPDKCLLW
jgi:predicted metalloendopeptidase